MTFTSGNTYTFKLGYKAGVFLQITARVGSIKPSVDAEGVFKVTISAESNGVLPPGSRNPPTLSASRRTHTHTQQQRRRAVDGRTDGLATRGHAPPSSSRAGPTRSACSPRA